MRTHCCLAVLICLLMLAGLSASACNGGEPAAGSPTTQSRPTVSTPANSAEHGEEDDHEDEGRQQDEDDQEGDETEADADEDAGVDAAAFEVRRGCPACHHLVEPDTGKYTLGFEAHERAEARGRHHPDAARDGTPMGLTDEPNVSVCLTCHAAGTGDREGLGLLVPLSLRDIVHPSHLFSDVFVGTYRGNCMSCHNVSGEGVWQILSEAVEVNEKGVPSPGQLPIPGLLDPSGSQ